MKSAHEDAVIEAVKKTIPGVVSIIIAKTLEEFEKSNPFGQYFGGITPEESQELMDTLPRTDDGKIRVGGGSGFIVDSKGIILTNKHVVMEPDAAYTVITMTGDKYPARVMARDPINDVAILKIENDGVDLPTVTIGDSKKIQLGQSVIAIGTALGEFQNSVSCGIVSGLSRFISAVTDMEGHQERLRGLIQTDAAINPGNSGGPLVNLSGEAIGINSAVVFGAQNIGFAIPIHRAKDDLDDLKKFGKIRKPFLGIRYLMLNKAVQAKFKLPIDHGAMILREHGPEGGGVVKGGSAHHAGLKEFDIILECDKSAITDKNTIEDLLDRVNIGDSISMKVLRGDKELSFEMKVGER
ncbi:MAG: hypothetical protein A3I44_01980 [Candidatus Sungbacteria bacterium RIFCSPLOWO2_02_FULL_51_17]|nr:MAG: hypothetical protein A2676_04120 [Candidatus Sungbacteria bacterium RIFCSPHIGHO2_01_FULL_51_22]OHA07837.1 MAG: hypothetical protein A3B29_00685 [Candidatus Sungbacteria bacterium RIFCSPLOWO2_01_FULL_51_34]OHA11429.1 MAG: hypothetical protein A3I44_01980 [Candidatus Sungbacteria bacterium RIFCSPLOWO2_02_FULL_51_17]